MIGLVVILGCKRGEKPAARPANADCKPIPDLCTKFRAADLEKLFGVAAIASYNNDSPLGPLDICNYKHDAATENYETALQVTLRYGCFATGAQAAAAEYMGLKTAVATAGGKVEDLTGLGDEAYWYHSAGNSGFIQGHINARKGAVIMDMLLGHPPGHRQERRSCGRQAACRRADAADVRRGAVAQVARPGRLRRLIAPARRQPTVSNHVRASRVGNG